MNINIKATNTKLTTAIRSAVEDKLSILEPFLKPEDKIHLELAVDNRHKSGPTQGAEITIHPHGHFAMAHGVDVYEALDLLVPKIKEQLTKAKDKKIALRRKFGAKAKRG